MIDTVLSIIFMTPVNANESYKECYLYPQNNMSLFGHINIIMSRVKGRPLNP